MTFHETRQLTLQLSTSMSPRTTKSTPGQSGRYLSYKMTLGATDYKDFEFSGFDIDVTQTGAR